MSGGGRSGPMVMVPKMGGAKYVGTTQVNYYALSADRCRVIWEGIAV